MDARQQMLSAFTRANPHLAALGETPPAAPAYQDPLGTVSVMSDIQRIAPAGGLLAQLIVDPAFLPLEQLYRKKPNEGVFQATRQRNYVFELGAFIVPVSMALLLTNFRFDIYRFSGFAPGDTIPIEERRLSTMVSYQFQVDQFQTAQAQFQLDPGPITPQKQAYSLPISPGINAAGLEFNDTSSPQIGNPLFPPSSPPFGANAVDFANARAAASASPGGAGLASLPQRHERLGALNLPYTLIVREGQRVAFNVCVFSQIPIPLAFFELDMTGLLMHEGSLSQLLAMMTPPTKQGTIRRPR